MYELFVGWQEPTQSENDSGVSSNKLPEFDETVPDSEIRSVMTYANSDK